MSDLLKTKNEDGVFYLILNRPSIHNAFNDELIELLTKNITEASASEDVRLCVLTGEGRSFCAGADLNWMKSMVNYSLDENKADSLKLAKLFQAFDQCPKPIIGKINGAALGGGVGLVSICDFAITHEKSKFGFTETRLGLVPSVISPYCIRKIGESQARAWFISGERFSAKQAQKMNLVHKVTTVEDFDVEFEKLLQSFLAAAPKASVESKKLVYEVLSNKKDIQEYTVDLISKLRCSKEGQEGMSALLEKRKPVWPK